MNEGPSGQRRSLMDIPRQTIAKPRTPRILLGAVLLALAHFGAGNAFAALGEVVNVSALGEPLRVEIRAPGIDATRLTCLQVASGAAPAGVEAIREGVLSVSGSGANARLLVRGRAPTREPIAQLSIRDLCEARLERSYTLFLDPPRPRAVTPQTPQPRTTPQPPAQSAKDRREQTWATVRGESLDSISRALYPNDAAARRRFNDAAVKANPELFAGGASITTPLPPGAELRIPDLRRAPSGQKRSTAEPTIARPPERASRSQAQAPSNPTTPTRPGKLVLEGEQADAPLPAAPPAARPGATVTEAELVERERLLVAAIDRTIKNQLEMSERLRRLEEVQVALRAQLEVMPALTPQAVAPAPPPASDDAARTRGSDDIPERGGGIPERGGDDIPSRTPARSAEPERDPGLDLQTILLGAGGLALAAAALMALRRRREAVSAHRDVSTETAADVSVWPDEAPTSVGERSAIAVDRTTTPSGFSIDGLESRQPQPARSPLAFHTGDEVASPEAETLPPVVIGDEVVEEHDSAVELADIMISFGRVHGAAETLADFIRSNPKQAVTPWLKLMEVYRLAGMRMEFDALARQLNKTFNVKAVTWDNFDEARQSSKSIESMPHLCETLTRTWRTRECQAFLEKLLRDNRDGLREGFPISAIDEILTLSSILEDQIGKYKPDAL